MAKFYYLLPVLFVVINYSVIAIGDDSKQIGRECKPFPHSFFDSVPFLLDFIRWVAWFFSNVISAIYFVLNTTVITVCEIISNIFSCFKHAIKLVEFLGYCIRAILQVNYNFVSSIFAWLAKVGRLIAEATRYIAEGILSVILSAFRLILSLIRGIISSIPTGFDHASYGASSAKNTTGLLLYQSYLGWKYMLQTPTSALMTVVTSIRAVMECAVMSIWNTGVLLAELLCTATRSIFHGIEFVGKTVQTCTVSAWNQFINFLKLLLHGFQSLLITIGQFLLGVGRTFMWLMTFIFQSGVQGFYTIFSTAEWLVTQTLSSMYRVLIEIGKSFLSGLQRLQNLTIAIAYRIPGGRWTLLSFVSSAFLLAYSWSVLRVNLFAIAFEQLENYIQGVLAFFTTIQTPSISRFKEMFTAHGGASNVPVEEKESNLREELERERDKNLCVVCQTENKNIVVMPCRHMCMCKNCCTRLFRIQRYDRRTCPLCRHTITSIMEIYS